jgi:hypothetical protein
MSRRILAGLAVGLLGAASTSAATLSIDHAGVGCVAAESFPRLEARFAPADAVARAKVLFQTEGGRHWYAVTMKPEGGVYSGVLPRPKKSLKAFRYYIEATDRTMGVSRTPEYSATVVSGPAACQDKLMAGALASASVALEVPAGAAAIPAGFSSSGVGATTAAGGAAAGSGGGGLSTGVIVAGVAAAGAAAAGIAVATKGDDAATTTTTTPSAITPTTTTTTTTTLAPAPSLTGTWAGNRPDGISFTFAGCGACTTTPTTSGSDVVLTLTQSGSALSGNATATIREAPPAGCAAEPNCNQGPVGDVMTGTVSGTVNGANITMQWTLLGGAAVATLTGTVAGNRMSGNVTLPSGPQNPGATGTWALNRQ